MRAWGWSSSAQHVGIWLVNPSVEYLSGEPTKFELSSHRDATFNIHNTTAPAPPTLLNYWRSSHYGGSICNLAATDNWTKVIGPFLIYCNSGNTPNAMWHDALGEAGKESKAWPFDWVRGVDYPHKSERATVTGKITLDDPQAPGLKLTNLLVGLTAPDYPPAVIPRAPRPGRRNLRWSGADGFGLAGGGDDEAAMTNLNNSAAGAPAGNSTRTNSSVRPVQYFTNRFARFGGGEFGGLPHLVDWQTDAKNYQFWVRADTDGNFSIPNVRPGNYSPLGKRSMRH